MRFRRIVVALAVLPFAAVGCGAPGTPSDRESDEPAAEEPWVVVEPGRVTPSPARKPGGSPRPALPPVSFLPTSASCKIGWPEQDQVLIPMIVTPGIASLTVQWPNRFGNTYRVAAVPQELVSGAQPEPTWQTVTTGTECDVSATITGLKSGAAYIVWLDAPDTPRRLDGSRSLYSGRSAVVIPN
jgi:hypothetical protein